MYHICITYISCNLNDIRYTFNNIYVTHFIHARERTRTHTHKVTHKYKLISNSFTFIMRQNISDGTVPYFVRRSVVKMLSSAAVSYTHLDVYKRQLLQHTKA